MVYWKRRDTREISWGRDISWAAVVADKLTRGAVAV
jgi:hypothetical protein